MNAKIVSVGTDSKGKTEIKIDIGVGSTKRLYGLYDTDAIEGRMIEYEVANNKSGYPYYKFVRFTDSVDITEKNVVSDDDNIDASYKKEDILSGVLTSSLGKGNLSLLKNEDNEKRIISVSGLNALIDNRISKSAELNSIWVKGEVTNYSPKDRGHLYFSIKDEFSMISCIIWESKAKQILKFELKKGLEIAVRGSVNYYTPTGSTSFVIDKIENIGEGAAGLKYAELKEKLQNEGLFNPEYKKEIPKHATKVGVVTSKDGQAIKDILKVAKERNPYVQIYLYHVNVQGKNALSTSIEGILELDKLGLDCIIVGRGGGSDEELSIYDEEKLIRVAFEATTPIISAVGHQGHTPLLDNVADLRVATPTDAAQHIIFDVVSEINRVKNIKNEIDIKINTIVKAKMKEVQIMKSRIESNSPASRLERQKSLLMSINENRHNQMLRVYQSVYNRFNVTRQSMNHNFTLMFNNKKHRCEKAITILNGLSPTAKLVKGYGYISKNGKPVSSIDVVGLQDDITVKIHDGEIVSKVIKIEHKKI